jgi:hypothetical protein
MFTRRFFLKVNLKNKHTPQTKKYLIEDTRSSGSHGLFFSTSGLEVIFSLSYQNVEEAFIVIRLADVAERLNQTVT